jgi:hypothetical protein
MRLVPFLAGLIGALAMLAGSVPPPYGEQAPMVQNAEADDRGRGNDKAGDEAGRLPPSPSASMPMARDPSAAVAEEYDMARQRGTKEAFELFIARHGDDPLAERVRAELRRLAR